ncbi:MAG: ATP-binding protein [Dysgonamonadaceae bacterium]|nr:ATP-binding protein [Dysgonamonadaceae bacterium]
MIIKFSVSNFGCIKEKQTLSFEADNSDHLESYYVIKMGGLRLLKLALIYGANASGKTTVLKALDFLRGLVLYPENKKTVTLNYKPYQFDDNTPNENSTLSIDFIQNDVRYSYNVEFQKNAIVNESLYFESPKKAKVFSRTTDMTTQFTTITFGGKIKTEKTFVKTLESNTLWNNTVLGGFLKTNIELHELKEATDWFKEYLKPMVHSESKLKDFVNRNIHPSKISKDDIINILKKADFNLSNIIIKKEEVDVPENIVEFFQKELGDSHEDVVGIKKGKVPFVNVEFEHTVNNRKYILPFDDESQGTKRYYGFSGLLAMLIKTPSVLPIDELEASLHPDLYTHFILSFVMNAEYSQVIATTHNREILDNKDIFRNDAIWFTNKSEDCATDLYSLADFDSSVIRDTSNILNAYKSGKLGGTPNLDDYYLDL